MELIKLITSLAARNLRRNIRRTALTLLALAAGVWGSVALAAMARGVSEGMARDAIRGLTGHIQISSPRYLDNPSRDLAFALNQETLVEKSSDLPISAMALRTRLPGVVASERESAGITIVGIDPDQEKAISFLGDGLAEGSFFTRDGDGVIIGKKLAENLQTRLGKRVVILTQGENNTISSRGFRVIGIFDSLLESRELSFAFISLPKAQELSQIPGKITEASLITGRIADSDKTAMEIKRRMPELEVSHWSKLEPLVVSLRKIQDGFLKIWFVIVILAISFGLVNTLFMAIFERVREFGLMESLGLKKGAVVALVVVESFILIILGAIIGDLAAFASVYLVSGGIDISKFAKGADEAGISSVIYPMILTRDVFWANLLILVIGLAASIYPAYRASRLSPVDALRST